MLLCSMFLVLVSNSYESAFYELDIETNIYISILLCFMASLIFLLSSETTIKRGIYEDSLPTLDQLEKVEGIYNIKTKNKIIEIKKEEKSNEK